MKRGQAAPFGRWWRYTIGLAVTALLCAVLLGGLSAWFLGSVAIAGLSAAAFTFNFHIPGALIRLLAIGRTVARYGERLAGHRAALLDQVGHRISLFAAMSQAASVRRSGWQFGDQARLTDYLDDVEDIDFARLRADIPSLTLCCAVTLGLAATAWVSPLALGPIVVLLAAILLAARWLARAGGEAWARARALRRDGAQRLGAAMSAVVPLQAEGAWSAVGSKAIAAFSEADGALLSVRRYQAAFDTLCSLLGPAAALVVIGGAWLGGARDAALLLPLFVAFAWLALGESMGGASRVPVAWLRRREAAGAVDRWLASPAAPDRPEPRPPTRLEQPALQRRAPDGRPLGRPVSILIEAARPTILTGASGSGKTSLLKQIAGWIGDDSMSSDAGELGAPERMALSFFCPHDAAILADTVRANLFAPTLPDAELWQALDAVEMTERVRQAGGLDGWITQATLSLGEAQRINLARAWLSDRPIVLLDEPTGHLDPQQGRRILGRVLVRLGDRVVALSSHQGTSAPNARVVAL